ncbi:condensin complex subunit 2-like [Clavelina lepadiformis]|uniref:condensin complex subunit 2-like n=1 Tax=Clavelina lepadiformis TaxID=159417 RepID=UPI004041A1D6
MNTPLSHRGPRSPLTETLISPMSGPSKHVGSCVSAGMHLLHHSPDLPEAEENERSTSRQRRRSRNFGNVVLLSKSPSFNAEELSETRPNVKWSKDQLLQHYSKCMKLSQENKINHKNAFDLQLIEHMGEMIKQDGALDFRIAGGTIFAGAKIYASRVDAIHSEVYRMLSSLGSGEKDLDKSTSAAPDEEGGEETEKRTKKRKKSSKILVTNESSLRVANINSACPIEAVDRLRGSFVDAASCDSFKINQTSLDKNETIILFDLKVTPTQIHPPEPDTNDHDGDSNNLSAFHSIVHNAASISKELQPTLCDVIRNFDFNVDTSSLPRPGNESESLDCPVGVEDDFPDDPIDCVEDSPETIIDDQDDSSVNVMQPPPKPVDLTDTLDLANLALCEPGEYSFFKPSTLSTLDGPTHWMTHKSARHGSTNIQGDASGECEVPAKRKKTSEQKTTFDQSPTALDKRLQPQKTSKAKRDSARTNMRNMLLLESSDFMNYSILRAIAVKVLLRPLSSNMITEAGVTVSEQDQVQNFNYVNDEYCPVSVDSDYDCEDTIECNLSPQSDSQNFFPNLTQNVSSQTFNTNEMNSANYSRLIDGDHLISQPRKVEKIAMTFARRAKPINVRKLKGAIWILLNDDDKVGKETEPTTENEDTQQPVPDEAPASDVAVERLNEEKKACEEEKCSEDESLFSKICRTLPANVSQSMSENLSVPIIYNCLLHLANEKQLKLEGCANLSDVKISVPGVE